MSAQPKPRRAVKPKEKSRSGGHGSHRPKQQDGLGEARRMRSRQKPHGANVSRTGVSKDGLREAPKEIPHEALRDRDREAYQLPVGHVALHARRDGPSRHSAASAGHRPGTKHSVESRSKAVSSHAPVAAQHRLSSDTRPSAGVGAVETRLASGSKAEAKLPTKVT